MRGSRYRVQPISSDSANDLRKGKTMTELNASKSGTFKIGGDLTVNRLGFGAMRITGKGIWGEPEDREESLRTLKRRRNSASTSSTPPIPMAPMCPSA